jgi:transcriptional regulator with XRE-family HTH domain
MRTPITKRRPAVKPVPRAPIPEAASIVQRQAGERMKWVRQAAGLTQKEVGDLIGVASNTVTSWEKGKNAVLAYYAIKFCNVFKVSLDYLFRGSLQGVDGELAVFLVEMHPELRRPPSYMD